MSPAIAVAAAPRLAEIVDRHLAEIAGRPETLVLTLPAPATEPERLLEVAPGQDGFLWHPPAGRAVAGVGAAHKIELRGEGRCDALRDTAARIWPRLVEAAHPDCEALPPRLFGGLAFAIGAADGEPWEEHGDGAFTLPRLAYARDDDGSALLTLAVRGEQVEGQRDAIVGEVRQVLAALAAPAPVLRAHGGGLARARVAGSSPSRTDWCSAVEDILAGIARGDYDKVVAARRTTVELPEALATAEVLRRLSRGLRASTRYAFCRSRSAFLGATPERLISRRGRRIETEALAGSIGVGGERAARLLSSGKDLREHQLVVDEIERRLRPLCAQLEVAARPQIRELRDVLHLHTPIVGNLAADRHVLDLVDELHPTPAVGGVPKAAALDWIASSEPEPRGWYAAPIGWFDASGDGEFAVALRASLLRGRRAYLYAGAGIVGDSDPRRELSEIELKEQALLTALEV